MSVPLPFRYSVLLSGKWVGKGEGQKRGSSRCIPTLMGLWLSVNQRTEVAKERLEIDRTLMEMEGFWAQESEGPGLSSCQLFLAIFWGLSFHICKGG